jgi:TonB family protein
MIVVLTVLLMSAGGQTLPANDESDSESSAGAIAAPMSVSSRDTVQPDQAPAQPATTAGVIAGTVRDVHGGVIPGVTVTVTSAGQSDEVRSGRGGAPPASPGAPVSTRVVTDSSGSFSIGNLAPGRYDLTASIIGFKTARHTFVTIAADQVFKTEIRLEVGALTEAVVVRSPLTAAQAAGARSGAWPRTPADYFEAAKIYYEQGRLTEAEAMTTRALELMRQSAPAVPPAPPSEPGTVLRVGGSIVEPKRVFYVPPIYPADAAAAGVEGTVIIEAFLAKDGTVKAAKILRSVPGLDQAALGSVQQWRFTPTLLNRVPVEILMTVSVTFTAK